MLEGSSIAGLPDFMSYGCGDPSITCIQLLQFNWAVSIENFGLIREMHRLLPCSLSGLSSVTENLHICIESVQICKISLIFAGRGASLLLAPVRRGPAMRHL